MSAGVESKKKHAAWVDLGRVVAAVAVVWIHTAESAPGTRLIPFCRFAVPFFVVALVFYLWSSATAQEPSILKGIWKRAGRLYVPFLFWTFLYLAFRFLKHGLTGGGSRIDLSPAVLLNGSAHHLWFLPFALLVSALTLGLRRFAEYLTEKWVVMLGVVLFVLGIVLALVPSPMVIDAEGQPVSYFVGMSWDALPSALMAFLVAILLRNCGSFLVAFAALTVSLLVLLINWWIGSHTLLATLAGLALFVFCLTAPEFQGIKFRSLAAISLGIYLSHVVFIEGLQVLLRKANFKISLFTDMAVAILALLGSIALCLTCYRVRILRPLVS